MLVSYLQLCNQALPWLECGLPSEMRPKCGLLHRFDPHADQVRNCGPLWKHYSHADVNKGGSKSEGKSKPKLNSCILGEMKNLVENVPLTHCSEALGTPT